jgi:hypothetical protein
MGFITPFSFLGEAFFGLHGAVPAADRFFFASAAERRFASHGIHL